MLNNASYNLMETASVLSKGLHRYGAFQKDGKDCAECQQIWQYMQRTEEDQLKRILGHLKDHFGKEV